MTRPKIGIIGAGRMGGALLSGLKFSPFAGSTFIVYDVDPKKLKKLKAPRIITALSNLAVVKSADLIILAVKPQAMGAVLAEIAPQISKSKIVISIAAGITLERLAAVLPTRKIFRVMPNQPSLAGEGISAYTYLAGNSRPTIKLVEAIFKAVGEVVAIPEAWMDAVTGVSGSGPAFVYYFVESLINAGVDLGLSRPVARKLVLQTVAGSITMLKSTGDEPKNLIAAVASPGGTTLAGLKVLDDHRFNQIAKLAVKAAAARSKELRSQ